MKHGIELYTGRYIQASLRGCYIEIENLQFCTVTERSLLLQKTPIVNFYMEDIIWGRLTVSVGFFYYKLNLMDGFNIISDHIVRGHHLLSGMSNKKTNLDSCHFSRGALYEVFLTWIKLQVDKKRNIFDSNGNTGCLFEL